MNFFVVVADDFPEVITVGAMTELSLVVDDNPSEYLMVYVLSDLLLYFGVT